jgi:hypothetical protein
MWFLTLRRKDLKFQIIRKLDDLSRHFELLNGTKIIYSVEDLKVTFLSSLVTFGSVVCEEITKCEKLTDDRP